MEESVTEHQQNKVDICEMEETIYDLCIIGAGLFGSVAARHASLFPDMKICLIGLDEWEESELEHQDIGSSHYDEGKIVKVLFPSPAYQKLSRASIKGLKNLEEISGIKFYEPVGFMNIGKKGSHEMLSLEDVSAAVETPLIKFYDTQFLEANYPFLKMKEEEYALFDYTGAGIINAHKMLEAERKIAQKQGCHILLDTVKDVTPLFDNHHMVETTNHGNIKSKRILFTTRAWSNFNNFSVLPQLESYVYKEMAMKIEIPHFEAERLSTMPAIVRKEDKEDAGFYVLPPVQYRDGKYYLKAGSMACDKGKELETSQEIKAWYLSKDNKSEEIEAISKRLFKALPGLIINGIFQTTSVTFVTPTGFPYIDKVTPTVTLAAFANGSGSCIAEEVGKLAAALSLSGFWDSDIPKPLFEMVLKEKTG